MIRELGFDLLPEDVILTRIWLSLGVGMTRVVFVSGFPISEITSAFWVDMLICEVQVNGGRSKRSCLYLLPCCDWNYLC